MNPAANAIYSHPMRHNVARVSAQLAQRHNAHRAESQCGHIPVDALLARRMSYLAAVEAEQQMHQRMQPVHGGQLQQLAWTDMDDAVTVASNRRSYEA